MMVIRGKQNKYHVLGCLIIYFAHDDPSELQTAVSNYINSRFRNFAILRFLTLQL